MSRNIFLQSELLADVEVIELDERTTPGELRAVCLSRISNPVEGEMYLFVQDDDDECGVEKLTDVVDGLRVHLHRLKAIDVSVRYAGKVATRTFRPNATIGRVKQWAAQDFGISASDAAELMLQISGTNNRPDEDVHIGALVVAPLHAICFDLVPAPRVNGSRELQ